MRTKVEVLVGSQTTPQRSQTSADQSKLCTGALWVDVHFLPIGVVMTLLRLPEVVRISGYSRSTLYALIAQGLYPKPLKISERCVAWRSEEVESMVTAVVSQSSADERRQLVRQLDASRKLMPSPTARGE